MDYKKICNKHINELSIELMDNGMPMHETACLMLDIYAAIKKHLGDEKCTK